MSISDRAPVLRSIVILSFAAIFSACEATAPTLDTAGEQTFDGLYPVSGSSADYAWARDDIDLSVYTRIRLQPVGIEYRPGGESGRTWASRSTFAHYEVTDEQKERFERVVMEVFADELKKSERFELTDETGPDVLLIRGALLDVVSYVPPERAGRSEVFLSRVGEATIVLEIRDSITEAILVRAIDSGVAEGTADTFTRSNRASNTAEVRRLVRGWASRLRERLDEFGGTPE